jgi:hypothetical protein
MSISSKTLQDWLREAKNPETAKVLSGLTGGLRGPFPGEIEVSQTKCHENRTEISLQNPKSEQFPPALEVQSGREAPCTGRPHVCFTLRRVRLLDVDAKWGSVKDTLDGLQYSGLIPGDREDQITLEVRQEKVKSFKDEETIIVVEIPD